MCVVLCWKAREGGCVEFMLRRTEVKWIQQGRGARERGALAREERAPGRKSRG